VGTIAGDKQVFVRLYCLRAGTVKTTLARRFA